MRPARSVHLRAAALAAAVLVAGCGGNADSTSAKPTPSPTPTDNGVAQLTAKQILSRAETALGSAKSVHIKGNGKSDGQPMKLDFRIGANAGGGTLTLAGQTLEILRVGQTVYVKANEAFWKMTTGSAAAAELLKGRYLKAPATDKNVGELAEFTDLKKAAHGLLEPDGEISKGAGKTIRDIETIGLVNSGADGGTLYVATRGQPYPLQIVSTGKSDAGTVDFFDYGVPVTIDAPPADQVVDSTKLGG